MKFVFSGKHSIQMIHYLTLWFGKNRKLSEIPTTELNYACNSAKKNMGE